MNNENNLNAENQSENNSDKQFPHAISSNLDDLSKNPILSPDELQRILKPVMDNFNLISETINSITPLIAHPFSNPVKDLLESSLKIFSPKIISKEDFDKGVKNAKELGEKGWCLHPDSTWYTYLHPLDEILAVIQDDLLSDIDRSFDVCTKEIREMIEEGYKNIIDEASGCFEHGYCRACFALLISQIDRKLFSFLNKVALKKESLEKIFGKMIEKTDIHQSDVNIVFRLYNLWGALLSYFKYVKFETFDVNKDDVPNRHTLLHGHSCRVYTKEDCLKLSTVLYTLLITIDDLNKIITVPMLSTIVKSE